MNKTKYLWLALSFLFYFSLLIYGESKHPEHGVFNHLNDTIPLLVAMTILSWILRYYRWYYLLKKAKLDTHFYNGILPYIAGFSFTATPGKIGELIRVRYFSCLGHKSKDIVSVFVAERTSDLLAVLILAFIAFSHGSFILLAISFVTIAITLIFLILSFSRICKIIPCYLYVNKHRKLAKVTMAIINGVVNSRKFMKPIDIFMSVAIGIAAWGLLAYAFVLLLESLNISVPITQAISIYPLAMLTGAASMLPGGVGSTESAITLLLIHENIPTFLAMTSAIFIRIITLWLAILLGIFALVVCERKYL